ncbi:HAMP domain-containing histidine kinase [Microbispora sp. RL4-1S]|uniref:histidine kinase n=1 Tax=Microbispora oryzae TaxID=2806554 RepID=A0A940WSK3_9ACTN|nr:HAMP domain-containing sensor histidine kinase [Microbispora oryzae]MBP2706266.1 HAMP domain-containing histidine kinase [Microbispora oryzae]
MGRLAPPRHLLNPRSLRWKIAALTAAAACAVTAVVGVLVHRATYDWSLTVGRQRAYRALDDAAAAYARTGDRQGLADVAGLPAPLPASLRPGETSTSYDDRKPGQPWMWAARVVDGETLAVRIDMGPEQRSLQALDRHIVMAALAALAVVVPLAALAAELPNRRLRRVARTARRIAGGDLDARIGTTGGSGGRGDEIAEISAAVDSMAGALQRRLLSEQRFTADVAHELRTPLMGLITSAELLPDGEATDLVRDRVRVLWTLVENLLEISRLDAGAERADRVPVPVGRIVEESVRRTGLRADVTVIGAPVAETDPRRLDRIIANLVINAHRHGLPPVEVAVAGQSVVVRDHGQGFPEELLTRGPERFRTGAAERGRGHGLGLTIALGQARVIDADLTLANDPAGGAVVTLRLPATAGQPSPAVGPPGEMGTSLIGK